MKKRAGTDWEAELQDDEKVLNDDTGKEVVLLRGLRRLARLAGLKRCDAVLSCVSLPSGGTNYQCKYTVEFDDESQWVGCSDCNQGNTSGDYLNYPTAVAESRAEARALKNALGITLLAHEELSLDPFDRPTPASEADSQQVRVIEELLKELKLDGMDLLQEIIEDKDRQGEITSMGDLSFEEAQKAMSFLNGKRSKKGKKKNA